MPIETLEAALEYARTGWYVLPLWWPDPTAPTSVSPRGKPLGGCACRDPACQNAGKHPIPALVPNGKDGASCDLDAIARWWASYPDANVGIATERSNLVVLDVDVAEGKQGRESLAEIDAQLTPTPTAVTGSGGIHGIYARPAGMQAVTSIGAPGKPLPHLDLIGDGYIVAAPSLHRSGKRYTWATRGPLAPLPPVLIDLIARRRAHRIELDATTTAPKISEGGRNAAMFRLGAALRGQGLEGDALKAAMHFTNRDRFEPPLPDDEVAQVYAKVLRHARVDRDAAYGAVIANDYAALFPAPRPSNIGDLSGSPRGNDAPDAATFLELLPVLEAESKLPVAHLPFEALDAKIGGLPVHSTTLLIGGTGRGKSSLAAQIVRHHATSYGPGIYYVGEMTRSLIVARIAGQALGRSWIDIIRGKVAWPEIVRVLGDLPMVFVKRSDRPVQAIAAACERAVVKLGWQGIPMIVADYLQIMRDAESEMRAGVVATVRDLQRFTEDAPVITLELSQTSRAGGSELAKGVSSSEQARGKAAETSEAENGATNELTISYTQKDDVTVHPVTLALGKGRFGGGKLFGFEFDGATGIWTPTAKPPASEDHEERCATILSHVMLHHAGKCVGGTQACGRDLTPLSFSAAKHPHRIPGSKEEIARAVEDLIDLRRIAKIGNTLMTVAK